MSAVPVTVACLLLLALSGGCSGGQEQVTPAAPAMSTGSTVEPRAEQGFLVVRVRQGDRCPHVPAQPDPSCDPLPLAGAPVLVRSGGSLEERTTDEAGVVRLSVDAGPVEVVGKAFGRFEQTLVGTAHVEPGATSSVVLTYGTGIQ